MSFSTNCERSKPIIVAWISSRCDAVTDRWIVDLTFCTVGGFAGFAAARLRGLADSWPAASSLIRVSPFCLPPVRRFAVEAACPGKDIGPPGPASPLNPPGDTQLVAYPDTRRASYLVRRLSGESAIRIRGYS